jgi:hypothetical protein
MCSMGHLYYPCWWQRPNFQPFHTCPLLHPCPTLTSCYLQGWQISSSSWPLLAGPAGLLTSLCAPCPPATRPGSLWSRHRLPPTFLGHVLVTLLMAQLHTHGPLARPLRITSTYGDMPRSLFSGHVTNQWSSSLAHAWRSRPHASSRPLVTFPFPQPISPYAHKELF